MTYKEKLEKSTIYKTGKIYYKDLNFPTAKQRRTSLVLFVFMALFTIYTKIILQVNKFDFMVFVVIVSLITTLVLKIVSQSVYALNHYKLVFGCRIINSLCKFLIFISAFNLYFTTLNVATLEMYNETFIEVLENIIKTLDISSYMAFLFHYKLQLISFIGTIIIFIPVFIYLLIVYVKLLFILAIFFIPIFNIFFYLFWVFSNNKTFIEYVKDEDNSLFCTKNYRRINVFSYAFRRALTKLFFGGILIFLCYYYLYILYTNVL
ncbi:MAG: hypothetical protein ACI35S_03205 [Anaeroplasma sp.]